MAEAPGGGNSIGSARFAIAEREAQVGMAGTGHGRYRVATVDHGNWAEDAGSVFTRWRTGAAWARSWRAETRWWRVTAGLR